MEEKAGQRFQRFTASGVYLAIRCSRAGRAVATGMNEVLNLPNLSAAASCTVLAPFVCKDRFILRFEPAAKASEAPQEL
jgi:hypothetical protein